MELIILTDSAPYVSWGISKERKEIPNVVKGKPYLSEVQETSLTRTALNGLKVAGLWPVWPYKLGHNSPKKCFVKCHLRTGKILTEL